MLAWYELCYCIYSVTQQLVEAAYGLLAVAGITPNCSIRLILSASIQWLTIILFSIS